MGTINRNEVINILNDYAFSDDIHAVAECLNTLLESKEYVSNLDLIFMAIASSQLYGFLSYLTEDEQQLFFECDYYRSNSYRGIEVPFYNRGQLSFLHEVDQNKKVFFSAPTSFGKTSIVTEYILNNTSNLDNIMFVVPTNSLLEELFQKFQKYNYELKLGYNITTQPICPKVGRNILFLTPERFMIVAESQFTDRFDLIIMDETYKIVDAHNNSVSDFINHRSLRFRKVADLIAASETKVIFLSPFTYALTTSMSNFLSKHEICKIDRKLEYVRREIIKLDGSNDVKKYFGNRIAGYQRTSNMATKVKLILSQLYPQSSIVYVPNYSKAYDVALALDNEVTCQEDARYNAFLNHLKENFLVDNQETWAVFEGLKKGIGIYIAPLPRYIKKEIIRLFENKIITTLVVTSAFTEGVNTCASNLIFTSLVNGPPSNKLSDIDVLNVSGRAGRFAKSTVGRIFCINDDIFNRVSNLQRKNDIRLENYNYIKSDTLLDYEIEMMDDEYLNNEQKELLQLQQKELLDLGLTRSELNISLNVSNNWKIILYRYFSKLDTEKIIEIGEKILAVYDKEDGKRVPALDYIFHDLNNAFKGVDIDVFPHEPYEIGPFDRTGKFTWGRMYQMYVSGTPKKIVANNIAFIRRKYIEATAGHIFKTKCASLDALFAVSNEKWILKYFKQDLSLNMNAFYTETFKIISNIIQYKIPFYLTFYVSIFKLFTQKHELSVINNLNFDVTKLINIFEDGDTSEEYERLLDCGLPITTINKISDNAISINALKSRNYNQSSFDDYEKIIIDEMINFI